MGTRVQMGRREMICSAGAAFAFGTLVPHSLWANVSKCKLTDVRVPMAADNLSVVFDAAKCVQCGSCKSVCERMMSVSGFFDLAKTNDVPICVHCGQCTTVCEGQALVNRPEWQAVKAFCEGEVVAALRKLGADYVLDTCFAADFLASSSRALR